MTLATPSRVEIQSSIDQITPAPSTEAARVPLVLPGEKLAPDLARRFEAGSVWHGDVSISLIRCAAIAYESEDYLKEYVEAHGYGFRWFQARDQFADTQAFAIVLDHDIVLSFRGTETGQLKNQLLDLVTDLRASMLDLDNHLGLFREEASRRHKRRVEAAKRSADERHAAKPTHGGSGSIRPHGVKEPNLPPAKSALHKGFAHALHIVWKEIHDLLSQHQGKRLWLTGHSLGGALATVAAVRLWVEGEVDPDTSVEIGGLYTIGGPRVCNKRLAKSLQAWLGPDRVFRFYQALDPIPIIPPRPYKHVSGKGCYIGTDRRLHYGLPEGTRRFDSITGYLLLFARLAISRVTRSAQFDHAKFIEKHDSGGYVRSLVDSSLESYDNTRLKLAAVGKAVFAALVVLWLLGTNLESVLPEQLTPEALAFVHYVPAVDYRRLTQMKAELDDAHFSAIVEEALADGHITNGELTSIDEEYTKAARRNLRRSRS